MIKRMLSIGLGTALLAGSLYGLAYSLFIAERLPFGVLAGACFYGLLASYLLWADLLALPYSSEAHHSRHRQARPERR